MRVAAGVVRLLSIQLMLFVAQSNAAAEVASRSPGYVAATMLLYHEREIGTDTYPLRMPITQEFLRSDDGADWGSFLLYDRREKVLYSVSSPMRSGGFW